MIQQGQQPQIQTTTVQTIHTAPGFQQPPPNQAYPPNQPYPTDPEKGAQQYPGY